jgi:hypothetical protein
MTGLERTTVTCGSCGRVYEPAIASAGKDLADAFLGRRSAHSLAEMIGTRCPDCAAVQDRPGRPFLSGAIGPVGVRLFVVLLAGTGLAWALWTLLRPIP